MQFLSNIRKYIHNYETLSTKQKKILSAGFKIVNFLRFSNRTNIQKGNTATYNLYRLKRTKISMKGKNNSISFQNNGAIQNSTIQISGENNTITFGSLSSFAGVAITIVGNNNCIHIYDHVDCSNLQIEMINSSANQLTIQSKAVIWNMHMRCRESGNTILIGQGSTLYGIHGNMKLNDLEANEGRCIKIGDDCLFSGGIYINTADGHSVVDKDGNRVNPSRDVTIGNHVWIGTRAMCLKGSSVADNSVVAAGALVTKSFEEPNCVLGGSPAKVIKRETNWFRENI